MVVTETIVLGMRDLDNNSTMVVRKRWKMTLDNPPTHLEPNNKAVFPTTPWTVLDPLPPNAWECSHAYWWKRNVGNNEGANNMARPSKLFPGYVERGHQLWFERKKVQGGVQYYSLTIAESLELARRRILNENHRRFHVMRKYWLFKQGC